MDPARLKTSYFPFGDYVYREISGYGEDGAGFMDVFLFTSIGFLGGMLFGGAITRRESRVERVEKAKLARIIRSAGRPLEPKDT